MTRIAVVSVPATSFPVGDVLREYPDLTIELERIVPIDEGPLPFFWARGIDAAHLESVLDDHPAFESVGLSETFDTEALYRVVWADQPPALIQGFLQHDLTLLSGVGTQDGWEFHLRAPDTGTLDDFTDYCEQHGITIALEGLYTGGETGRPSDYDLTEGQREALVLAYEKGYFEHPRRISLEELAAIVGITRQSFAERLRRGHHNLIKNALGTGSD